MQVTEPAGPGLRSLILRHNPLCQLTFHRFEISRQGHPWVLFLPSPQCAAFKTIKLSFMYRVSVMHCQGQRLLVPPNKTMIRSFEPFKQSEDWFMCCDILLFIYGETVCSEITFTTRNYLSLCQLLVCLTVCYN